MGILKFICLLPLYLISIILTLGIPLLLLAISPLYLYRYLISKIAVKFHPTLGPIIPARSVISAIDTLYENESTKPNINGTLAIFIDGPVDLEEFRQIFEKRIVLQKYNDSDNQEKLLNPELQQFPYKYMGYLFWKWEKNFNINDHIYMYNPAEEIIEKDQFTEISIDLLRKPYKCGKSPWEIVIIKNYKEDCNSTCKTVLLLRLHHLICDGFSILKIVLDLFNAEKIDKYFHKNLNKLPWYKRILGSIGFFARMPFDLFPKLLESFDWNDWHGIFTPKLTKDIKGYMSPQIPLNLLKGISKDNNSNVTSVIIAGICGGVRNFMMRKDIKIPTKITCGMPLQVPNHPDGMVNWLTLGFLPLPVSQKDPLKRLEKIQKSLDNFKNSTLPPVIFTTMKLIGSLPFLLVRLFISNNLTTALLTNFRSADRPVFYKNYQITNFAYASCLLPGNSAIGFSSLSYNGFLTLIGGADSSIIKSNNEGKELVDLIVEEFYLLARIKKHSSSTCITEI